MKLFKKLNQVGSLHIPAFLGVVVVLAVGAVGYRVLGASHANPGNKNTTTGTTLYGYNDASAINGGTGTSIVTDSIGMVGAVFGSAQVIQVSPGGSYSYGGKGGYISNPPALLSGKTCYSLRPVGGAGQVSISSLSGGSQTFNLKAAPTPEESAYWQYVCVPYTSTLVTIPYNVKNTGTVPVNVYREDIIANYNY